MATLQMKIDSVHAEFLAGNAVSSTVSTRSVVARDGSGNVHANKFKSANMELTHNAAERSSDTVFYSSDGDIVYKNTAAGMRSSLNFENSAMIAATSSNIASNIVVRDVNGDFSAGTITAALTGNASTATKLATTRTIGGVNFNGTGNIDLPGVNTGGNQDTSGNAATASSCSGNAASATKLKTARTIGGVSFNGTANIDLPGVNTGGTQDTSGNAATATDADKLDGVHLDNIFNNMGGAHNNRSNFDDVPDAGCYYITGSTSGPGVNSATQYYGFTLGLGGHDPVVKGSNNGKYGCQIYWGRNVSNPYINVRYLEGGTWGGWNKAAAGYADSAGTASSCSGNAATATKLNTARTIGGVSFNGTANIDLPGVNADGNQNTSGSASYATNAGKLDNIDSSQFLRSDASDTVNAGVRYTWSATNTSGLKFVNASYSGYSLEVGGWTSSNSNNISRIRNSNGNLHIDSAANGDLYLNHYTSRPVHINSQINSNQKLTVTGYGSQSINDQRYFIADIYSHHNYSLGEDETYWYNTGILSSYWIRGQGLLATSDERVKVDIQTLDTEIALSKLEKIRPVSYKMKHTGEFMFGFIGQEIEKELPNVVNEDNGTIVDFNITGVFSNKQSIKYKIKDEEKDAFVYTLTLDAPIPSTFDVNLSTYIETACVNEGRTAEFFYDPEYCGKPEIGGTVMKLLSEKDNVKEGVSYKIIGTTVNDFRTLDYNEIFTVTTAALKEVNEQLKAEKIKTATLETKYEELLKRVEAIENP